MRLGWARCLVVAAGAVALGAPALAGTTVIRGRVYDAARGWEAGIGGATVALEVAGTKPGAEAMTDASGAYAITYALDDDDWVFLEATADGFYPERTGGWHGYDLRGGGAVNFALQPRDDVEIGVHVYDAAAGPGAGIAGARVGFWQNHTRYDLTTDADGAVTFTFMLPDSEPFAVWVSAEGFYPSLTTYSAGDVRRAGALEIALQAAPVRANTEVQGLVYDVSVGPDAPLADAEVYYDYYGNGVFPDASGSVRTGPDGRYRIALLLGPSESVSVHAEAEGFGGLDAYSRASDLYAGTPVDFGLPPLGGVVRIEPAQRTVRCAGDFTVTVSNDGPPDEILTIVGLSFAFAYGEGVYGREFTWDLSGVEFPVFLASGEQFSFPMSFRAGEFPTRLGIAAISGARSGNNAGYFGTVGSCDSCRGDCDGDGAVGIAELVRGVAMALDPGAGAVCEALDANGDALVSIAELVAAVDNALYGCPSPAGG